MYLHVEISMATYWLCNAAVLVQEVNVDCYLAVLWVLWSAGLSGSMANHLLDWMESEVMCVGLVSHSTSPLCRESRPVTGSL